MKAHRFKTKHTHLNTVNLRFETEVGERYAQLHKEKMPKERTMTSVLLGEEEEKLKGEAWIDIYNKWNREGKRTDNLGATFYNMMQIKYFGKIIM